jgi:carbon storage regulator
MQGVWVGIYAKKAAYPPTSIGLMAYVLRRHSAAMIGRQPEGCDMLVLSRKLGEKIFIGDNICITVVDIDRGKIRLGIEAPRDVPIYRQELLPLNHPRPDIQPAAAAS